MKNSSDTAGNRTRDLPACSAVPQVLLCRQNIYSARVSVFLYSTTVCHSQYTIRFDSLCFSFVSLCCAPAFPFVLQCGTLGFSYRASFICVTIRITNRCDFLYYVFISFYSSFPYMFRAFMGPSSGVFQAVVFMLPFGSCGALLIVCVRQRAGLWW